MKMKFVIFMKIWRNKMGRPINKKFFGNPASAGYQVACRAWFVGEGGAEDGYILSQRSNSVYVVASVAGPATRTGSLELVEGAPAAEGQMQVVVTPVTGQELTAAQDETAFASFAGGAGYTGGDTITLSNGDVITVDTVSTGEVTEFTVTTVNGTASPGEVLTQSSSSGPGTGFTLTVEAGNLTNTTGTPESARIINQHTVKTFEENIYSWPSSEGTVRTKADIGS